MKSITDEFIEDAIKHYKPTALETRPLMWKGQPINGYYIRNDGVLFTNRARCSSWKINGRNYSLVVVEGHEYSYRLDYMVAYTFLGMFQDAIRLIHINGDIADDRIDNLMWYRKADVVQEYIDLAIVEPDGTIKEEWRPCITEFNPNLGYEVSNFGMIRDKDHNMVRISESYGYRVFYYLDQETHKATRVKSIHRAVAQAFIPNPNGYNLVNHLDGNKFNDVVYNLEWADTSMNMEHSYLQGLNTNQVYTNNQIHRVCKLIEKGNISHVEIAKMTGVDRKTISDVYRGRRWAEISKNYSFAPKKWTPELKATIADMVIKGQKAKDISAALNIPYEQAFISLYERTRRELRSEGKI